MLEFNEDWRFESPGPIPHEMIDDFWDLIMRMAAPANRWRIFEHFKRHFAHVSGEQHYRSSSESWAQSDLESRMQDAAQNAPLFIEAFYDACEQLRKEGLPGVPPTHRINRVLSKHKSLYQIDPPRLVSRNPGVAIAAPAPSPSFDEQAREIIYRALADSESLLAEGRYRQAVQEALWLLETISTAFQGTETEAGTIVSSPIILGHFDVESRVQVGAYLGPDAAGSCHSLEGPITPQNSRLGCLY